MAAARWRRRGVNEIGVDSDSDSVGRLGRGVRPRAGRLPLLVRPRQAQDLPRGREDGVRYNLRAQGAPRLLDLGGLGWPPQSPGVLIGGLISLIAQYVASRASAKDYRAMLMIQEKIQHLYFVADLLVDLNKALNDCATAPIRPGEEVDEAQAAERDQQGASVVNTIFGVFDQIERGGNKITVIGGKEVVSCLKKRGMFLASIC